MPDPGDFTLLVDLHKDGERQGPGGEVETARATRLMEKLLQTVQVDQKMRQEVTLDLTSNLKLCVKKLL